MTPPLFGSAAGLARAALLALAAATLAACSGAVTDNTPVAPTPINILPATATLYSGLPATFTITGGNGVYILASSDQAAIPITGSVSSNSLTVVPGAVSADTPVTLTVRDSAGSEATAALTVKPRTVSNVITVTPSATQAAVCGSALCSGGDAEVKAMLSQNGVPISNRDVRFDVISGDLRVITSAAGTPETLSLSGTTRTDSTGTATIRVRATTDAAAQTALLQVTDVAGGATQRTSVSIFPVSSAPLSAAPATIQFAGQNSTACATGNVADVIVFGGRAPYQITQPASFGVTPTTLFGSGQRFSVTALGACAPAQAISIVDANGSTATVTVSNVVGPLTVTPPPLVVSPTAVTLTSCNEQANVSIAGGRGEGTYFGASGSDALNVGVNGVLGVISRRAGTIGTTTPLQIGFSDGRSVASVAVTLEGAAALGC